MSTPDAAPVEVEGEAVTWLHGWGSRRHIAKVGGRSRGFDREAICGAWAQSEADRFSTGGYSERAKAAILNRPTCSKCLPPAAPTTPDIADERVVEVARIKHHVAGRMAERLREIGGNDCAHDDEGYCEPHGMFDCPVNGLATTYKPAALATPSTPGDGQGWTCARPKWGRCTATNPHSDPACGPRPLPATGQGEPS